MIPKPFGTRGLPALCWSGTRGNKLLLPHELTCGAYIIMVFLPIYLVQSNYRHDSAILKRTCALTREIRFSEVCGLHSRFVRSHKTLSTYFAPTLLCPTHQLVDNRVSAL